MSFLANALWYLSSLPASARFEFATRNVANAQRKKLMALLRANATSAFGQHHHFDGIQDIKQYQAQVPASTYDDLRPWIERVEQGEQGVLTLDPVLLLEPTSGSAFATKYIPYTANLKHEFQRGIAPWVTHTFGRYPALLRGQAYWSVTPVVHQNRRAAGGLPIGFEEDSDYLGGWSGRAVRSIMAVPPEVKQIADLESFRYVTLLFLLRSRTLALISIWNPTFLMLLLEPLTAWWPQLAKDIDQGSISPPQKLPPQVHNTLLALNKPMPARAAEIATTLEQMDMTGDDDWRGVAHHQLWPHLALISCWADANAAPYAAQLARLFPHAHVQPKGLIATEAFVSFPLPGRRGSVLSLNSHFYEFMPVNGEMNNAPLLAHELEIGQHYSVVVTTGGGLYRYRMQDQIEVTGKLHECPLLRFTGREDQVSDWFGEKLNEQHIRPILAALCDRFEVEPRFILLAFDEQATSPAYTLYLQVKTVADDTLLELGDAVDRALRENYHYAYCRRMGQLGDICVFRIASDGAGDYVHGCVAMGQRTGDVKPTLLSRYGGWSRIFTGSYIIRNSHDDAALRPH